jgi:uncharacterized protein (UPF0332 family)
MDKIKWCINQKNGIRIIDPNTNLADAYIRKAEDGLSSLRSNLTKDWKISIAYYTVYFSLYAILMRIGIKCEIHSCTIEFVKRYLKEYFSSEETDFFERALEARIDAQYYIDRSVPDKQYQEMLKKTPEMLVKCKNIIQRLNEKKIEEIRNKLKP